MWMLLLPARTATPALSPKATLSEPVVFLSALAPTAVLEFPVAISLQGFETDPGIVTRRLC